MCRPVREVSVCSKTIMAALQEVGTDAATIFYQKWRVYSPKRVKKKKQHKCLRFSKQFLVAT